ncbi:MAG: hypothetical protein HRT44_05525 [Bdellovibrionales bacterium]|nr:hypothetical protein [Bdellovibrionales bacterium]NQZ18703.1 hypothetical protein [Bdellovibrionales bacterium]
MGAPDSFGKTAYWAKPWSRWSWRVGIEGAKRAQALGLKVRAFDPYIEEHDPEIPMMGFEELMRSSDIITLHVPKTKKTRHMIKAETLSWMSTDSLLVNMSRGDVIHEEDLIKHLIENKNFFAALDVFEREPLSKESALIDLPNVVLSPHVGASTEEALKASSQESVSRARDWLNNKALPGSLPPKAHWWGE